MKTASRISVKRIEKAVGIEAKEWNGNCYSIVCKILKSGLIKGHPIYGHYIGKISRNSNWFNHSGMGFARHGWILTESSSIIDPTRWCFEAAKPYIAYIDPDDDDYDDYSEGGETIRILMRMPCPDFDDSRSCFKMKLRAECKELVDTLLYNKAISTKLTDHQLMWLANTPYSQLGDFVPDLYLEIKRLGRIAFIPYDFQTRAMREYQIDL